LSPVLYGFDAWFLTLTEEYRLRAFMNTELRRIFGPRRNKVAGGRRTVHEELQGVYSEQVLFA